MIAVAAGVVLLVTLGLVSLGVYAVLSKRRAADTVMLQVDWQDPVSQIDRARVAPATALLTLAGNADLTAINNALRQGDLDSAYSLITLSSRLSDEERIGSLLLLGKRYAAADNLTKSRLADRQISQIAVLSPMLSDFSRADALLQSGEELSKIKQTREAVAVLNQARNIALRSVYLKPAHRKHILDRLIADYSALDIGRSAWEELEAALQSGGKGQLAPPESGEPVLGDLLQKETLPDDILSSSEERERKATVLAEYIRDRGGRVSNALVNDLRSALLVEDAKRQGAYEAGLLQAAQLADKINLLKARVHWLTLKYGVALKSQGISVVPAWEEQLGTIQSELAKARQDLYGLYGDQIVALPDASKIDRAWVEFFRHQLEMGRLGLYPNYPEEQLIAKLHDATQILITAGKDQSLRVDTIPDASKPVFILVDTADYSKGVLP